MPISLSPNLPANVVEIGVEIAQAKLDAINNASGPTAANPFTTVSYVTGLGYLTSATAAATYAPLASPTFTGTPNLPTGTIAITQSTADNSTKLATTAFVKNQGYITSSTAAATYQPIGSYLTDAPNDGNEYVRKNLAWAVATGGGGGLTISSLSNAATSTLNATAPTTGQALTFDGTELKWATVSGGGGATWGSITGTLSTQTDLQTVLDTKLQAKTVNTIGGGPAGVQLSDARKILYLASGGMGFQLSVDNDASTPYVDGTEITIVVDNPSFGYSVIAGPGPVTINGSSSASLTSYVSNLVKVAANTWFVS